ncbi:MAG TPA: hypothetical protein VLL96_06955 [Candidatus Deferrimicrobiaceae bacterium]|nr:hypothetical protein [Candidatus Deferrimicrobiaceae bacterium]
MLSRSAIVKLKAILIIDLIIVGAAAGVYLYMQDQGLITSGAKGAEFTLTDLVIDPPEAYTGEAVQISVNVTNIGDLEGNFTVDFALNEVVKSSVNVTLAGNFTSEIVTYTAIEMDAGNYSVKVGDKINALLGYFILNPAPPESSKILLSSILSTPYEIWPTETTIVSVIAENRGTEADRISIRVMVDDVLVNSTILTMDPGTSQTLQFVLGSTEEGKHVVNVNTLRGSFVVVKEGYHTLTLNRSGGGSKSLPITLNGEVHLTPYTALLPIGEYSVSVPNPFDVGTGVLEFSYWSDGVRSPSRTFTLDSRLILVVTYTLISGYASCPSLYIWNGDGYTYVTDVSNSGWLGYIGYINSDGTIVFKDGNPYDYVKLDKNFLATKNGNFEMVLAQQWDELYYLDSTQLLVVDHPIGTNVYMSMTSYLSDGSTGKVYTVTNGSMLQPVSAFNEKDQSVLAKLLTQDGVFTPGINGYDSVWNNITLNQLTLNLGNLAGAPQIKLVITGMVDWGLADPYYEWIDSFKEAASKGLVFNGTEIMPAPYLEVKAANGSWIRVQKDIPLPADYRARTYTVDLTGIFPEDATDYQIRFNNFWNVTYDYIGIDITPQAETTVKTVNATSATFEQLWTTLSTSSGAFTRYGDVTPLVLEADDMYVIGRQGDQVVLQFSISDLEAPAEGMERDYFFVVACWFKDPPGAWGYGFDFTVAPLPFIAMSGFPYTNAESYPYDAAHLAYLQQYNTRVILP